MIVFFEEVLRQAKTLITEALYQFNSLGEVTENLFRHISGNKNQSEEQLCFKM